MYWLLVAALLITPSDGRRVGKKKLSQKKGQGGWGKNMGRMFDEKHSADGDVKAWKAFQKLQPVLRKRGMSKKEALKRYDTFKANYEEIERNRGKFNSFSIGVNEMAVLTRKEQNMMLGAGNEILARSQTQQYERADPEELDYQLQDEVLRPGRVPNSLVYNLHRYMSKGKEKFPPTQRPENMAGYAFIAAFVMDLLNAIYREEKFPRLRQPSTRWRFIRVNEYNTTLFPDDGHPDALPPPWDDDYVYRHRKLGMHIEFGNWERYAISRQQLINCVYRDHGFKHGSPADALQYMSNNVIMLSMKQKHHNILTETSVDFLDRALLNDYQSDNIDPTCRPNTLEPTMMTVMQNVTFLPGKAYINFGDLTSTTEVLYKVNATEKDEEEESLENKWAAEEEDSEDAKKKEIRKKSEEDQFKRKWEDLEKGSKGKVMGEKLIKPLVYKKGAVLISVPMCITLLSYTGGLWNHDCTKDWDHKVYVDLWMAIVGYSRQWFLMMGHPNIGGGEAYTDPGMKFSRLESHKHVAHWGHLILPRTTKYDNSVVIEERHGDVLVQKRPCDCENGGRCAPDNKARSPGYYCYCPINKVGPTCADDCALDCKNGGFCRGSATQCFCPEGYVGPTCELKCDCGKFGKCDVSGVCTCPRQVAWGAKCDNGCDCGGSSGYCHKDGRCACLAGKAGPKCADTCRLTCKAPRVCRYSRGKEFCDCPFGFYGAKCDKRVDCREDTGTSGRCRELVDRHRCNNDKAKELCPNACGHCLWLRQDTQNADTKR